MGLPGAGWVGGVGGLGGSVAQRFSGWLFPGPGFVLMNNIAAKAKAKRVLYFFFCGTPQGLISNLHFLTFIYVFKYVRGVFPRPHFPGTPPLSLSFSLVFVAREI